MRKLSWVLIVLAACGLAGTAARAVVTTSDGTGNGGTAYTTANTPGWDYVGSVNGASGVYIGDYSGHHWVMTAAHVGAGTFSVGGYNYTYVPGSVVPMANSGESLPDYADLVMYRIEATDLEGLAYLDGLTNLTLSGGRFPAGTAVTMIGNGGGKSWGTNGVSGVLNYTIQNTPYGGPGYVTLDSNGVGATGGDSGGGFFATDLNGNLVLGGILSAVGNITVEQQNYGNGTLAVVISDYQTQIVGAITAAAIPEPAAWGLWVGGIVFVVGCRRRRREPVSGR